MRTRIWRASYAALGVALVVSSWPASAAQPPLFENLEPTLAEQQRLVAVEPGDTQLWNDLGNLLLLDRREPEAETAYRMAASLDANNTAALYNLALLQRNRGDLAEAEDHLSRVLELDSSHARAHYQMGAVYEAQKRNEAAIAEYARAFELDPELVFPRVNPDVIGNRLMLESLMKRRNPARARSLGTLYEDGRRIVGLLVPPIAESAPQGPAEEDRGRRGISTEDLGDKGAGDAARRAQAQPQPRKKPRRGQRF